MLDEFDESINIRLINDRGVDARTIQTQTRPYLNLTDEVLLKAMEVSWGKKKRLRLVSGA